MKNDQVVVPPSLQLLILLEELPPDCIVSILFLHDLNHFGKLVNKHWPIMQTYAILYQDLDLLDYPIVEKKEPRSTCLPVQVDKMSKYISAPMYNPKAKNVSLIYDFEQ